MLDCCIRGDVCGPGDVAGPEGGWVLPSTGEVDPKGDLLTNGVSACPNAASLLAMAAGAVGGERSGVCFCPVAEGAVVAFGARGAVSGLPNVSMPSSRFTRGSCGCCGCCDCCDCCGGPRSAFGPVGGCTGAREGSLRSFSNLTGDVPNELVSAGGFSVASPGARALTEPNAGTCEQLGAKNA